jgi:hypothetical protein
MLQGIPWSHSSWATQTLCPCWIRKYYRAVKKLHLTLSWSIWISAPSYPVLCVVHFDILPCVILGVRSGLIPCGFSTNILATFVIFPLPHWWYLSLPSYPARLSHQSSLRVGIQTDWIVRHDCRSFCIWNCRSFTTCWTCLK